MEGDEIKQLKHQLDRQDRTLAEIRDALLGSLDGHTVGLIADHRALKTTVAAHDVTLVSHEAQIQDVTTFKRDLKKMVAGVAFAIPFAFEVLKGLALLGWEYLKNLNHK